MKYKMFFHILSDVHLEFNPRIDLSRHFNKQFAKNVEVNLILAGDIGYPSQPHYKQFLKQASILYDHIFLVPGNHEYYQTDLETGKRDLKQLCDSFDNVHLLDNEVIVHNNVAIIGSTLWSYVAEDDPGRKQPINDYRQIRGYTIDTNNALFEKNVEFLSHAIAEQEEQKRDCIVITHHLPSYDIIHSKYKGHPVSCYFASHLDKLIRPPVKFWIYGHTHTASRHVLNGVEVLCNPKGYPSEVSTMDKSLSIFVQR